MRYLLVEAAVGGIWATVAWQSLGCVLNFAPTEEDAYRCMFGIGGEAGPLLAAGLPGGLDAEQLWLPDWLTLPGTVAGFVVSLALTWFAVDLNVGRSGSLMRMALARIVNILIAGGTIMLIRSVYWVLRHREGMGLGDAKLMAMLTAWLGLQAATLAFAIGVVLGALFAIVLLAWPSGRDAPQPWAAIRLPLGTFLCVGGLVSALWGQPIIAAYLRWAGILIVWLRFGGRVATGALASSGSFNILRASLPCCCRDRSR